MIKNLLFDLGGVIMDIEKARCVRAFEELGLPDAPSYFGDYVQKGPFGDVESGAISAREFRDIMRHDIGRPVTDAQIDAAFTRFLIGIPLHRLVALRELRKKYGIYLLSNTNPIMWNGYIAECFRQEGLSREDYFDGMITSFEAGCMKPEAEIFDYTARNLHILPSETLFLDDSAANCEAARRLGWNAAEVSPGTEFTDVLRSLGLM